jgi:hypothetical protein
MTIYFCLAKHKVKRSSGGSDEEIKTSELTEGPQRSTEMRVVMSSNSPDSKDSGQNIHNDPSEG